jgi:hypothetical protein
VYEEHIPETAPCAADVWLGVGAKVTLRREPANATLYKVADVLLSPPGVTMADRGRASLPGSLR